MIQVTLPNTYAIILAQELRERIKKDKQKEGDIKRIANNIFDSVALSKDASSNKVQLEFEMQDAKEVLRQLKQEKYLAAMVVDVARRLEAQIKKEEIIAKVLANQKQE